MPKKNESQAALPSHDEIIARYAGGVEQLETVLDALSEKDLDLCREQGKWSIRQIVHHIADAEDIWKTALKAALGNTGCKFDISWYIPDNKCAGPLDYAHRPIADAAALFKAIRGHIVQLLEHIPAGAWDKYIIFTLGEMSKDVTYTVAQIMEWQIQHLDIHIGQIRGTREVHGKNC